MGRLSKSRLQIYFSFGAMAMALMLLLPGCDNTDNVNPYVSVSAVAPTVSEYEIPAFWVFGSTISRDMKVQLSLSESVRESVLSGDLEPPRVCATIDQGPGGFSYVYLQDDGGSIDLNPDYGFIENYSGDLIPNDFIYNVRINSTFAENEGEYLVQLYAGWFDSIEDITVTDQTTTMISETMVVEINSPPVFNDINLPDSLFAGFDAQVWTLTVVDPDESAGDQVTDVTIHLILDETNTHDRLFTYVGNNEWSLSVDSSFAVALETRDYPVELRAIDVFEQETVVDTLSMWLENSPPLLFNVEVPDTVILPLEGANDYTFYASSSDRQGLGDIEKVYFTLLRPDGAYRDNNGLGFSFGDDGIYPDEVAGDGNYVYYFPLERDPDNPPVLGTYTFYFYAKDRAGNITGPISKEIEEVAETSETR